MTQLQTPYYLIDKSKLQRNMEKIAYVQQKSGAKALLALKCFATWSVFDFMSQYMAGTTSSSLYEVKLGKEKFGGETHAYSVAYSPDEIDEVVENADKIIFNSINQLKRYKDHAKNIQRGLRVNPRVSTSSFLLADPARPYSRLGEWDLQKIKEILPLINGFMFHNNCENPSFEKFDEMLTHIENHFGELLHQVDWVSLGGGIHFTGKDYPIDQFADRLKQFSEKFEVQVYLEPGEASITLSCSFETTILDVGNNEKDYVIVDSSIEAHLLDLLIYRSEARLTEDEFYGQGDYQYLVCGKSCLAGDIFGEYKFEKPLQIGDRLSFCDTAGYSMVKKNWFNGVNMPSIAIKELDGTVKLVKQFGYQDYVESLS
ncbi:carboxynorspermidine decarboxylase [Pasteurella atlantica]|uniref:carboxynorspermidine decarboxylase n=1 Tax=Pasteurellaceae TaxID=712 RepID=UPI00275B625F|nr:carboxynorspermidine decarboxylase [Pasteurella atlantica]MDP8098313.1 carboxynorspermidine decarboxylase [Pasteurella atlantica]MDP8106591.1 carboxynorspermidine decarboxylase [Pasteurella atlantica]MDP8116116.1 carboxynorspermidine decarboxylase [Pasteurella atlantica]